MAYDKPVHATYTLAAKDISSAATLMTVVGPKGKQGRLMGITTALTTATTGAASEIRVGNGSDADKFGTLSVPVAAIGSVANDATINAVDDNLMPADTAVVIASDGGSTAGAADIAVHIAWF